MKIGVDIDEVLAVLNPDLTDFYNRGHGTNWNVSQQTTYRLEKFWQCGEDHVKKVVMDFYNSPDFDRIKPVSGAKSAIKKLSKDHKLFVITSRPDATEPKTREWINKHFPELVNDLYFSNHFVLDTTNKKSKSDICRELGVELMIDDHFDYALDCSLNGISALLVDATYNQNVTLPKNVRRVKNWREIIQVLSV